MFSSGLFDHHHSIIYVFKETKLIEYVRWQKRNQSIEESPDDDKARFNNDETDKPSVSIVMKKGKTATIH